jgi:hypothetical protein
MNNFYHFLKVIIFWQYWGLNSGFCACEAGFKSCLQPFLLWSFKRLGLTFCPHWPGQWSFYFKVPTVPGMTGTCHHAQLLSVEMMFWKLFCIGWPWTLVLRISVFQVATTTVVSHKHLTFKVILEWNCQLYLFASNSWSRRMHWWRGPACATAQQSYTPWVLRHLWKRHIAVG